jgi:CRP-like cAMP-binding protein
MKETQTPHAVALSTPLLQRNALLASVSHGALMRLSASLEFVQLRAGQVLDREPPRAYFPLTALLSLQQQTPDGALVQVAMVGREGLAGAWMTGGHANPPVRSRVLIAGSALALDGAVLAAEVSRGGSVMQAVLRHGQSLILQMSQTALCNRHHAIEQQMARWLLMITDRLATDEVEATQEQVATLLGVRREGITEAAGRLREAGVIACRRGCFTVLHRQALQLRACACYGMARHGDGLPSPRWPAAA